MAVNRGARDKGIGGMDRSDGLLVLSRSIQNRRVRLRTISSSGAQAHPTDFEVQGSGDDALHELADQGLRGLRGNSERTTGERATFVEHRLQLIQGGQILSFPE